MFGYQRLPNPLGVGFSPPPKGAAGYFLHGQLDWMAACWHRLSQLLECLETLTM
jgi:hypothetical protein